MTVHIGPRPGPTSREGHHGESETWMFSSVLWRHSRSDGLRGQGRLCGGERVTEGVDRGRLFQAALFTRHTCGDPRAFTAHTRVYTHAPRCWPRWGRTEQLCPLAYHHVPEAVGLVPNSPIGPCTPTQLGPSPCLNTPQMPGGRRLENSA